jgi:hypothetical protein
MHTFRVSLRPPIPRQAMIGESAVGGVPDMDLEGFKWRKYYAYQ